MPRRPEPWEFLRVLSVQARRPRRARPPPKAPQPKPAPEELARAVRRFAALGFNAAAISQLTGLSAGKIWRWFRQDLIAAPLLFDADVIEAAYHRAVGQVDPRDPSSRSPMRADPSMIKLWLGKRQGWAPPPPSSSVTTNSTTNVLNLKYDLEKLTDDQLHQLEGLLTAAGAEADRRTAAVAQDDHPIPVADDADGSSS